MLGIKLKKIIKIILSLICNLRLASEWTWDKIKRLNHKFLSLMIVLIHIIDIFYKLCYSYKILRNEIFLNFWKSFNHGISWGTYKANECLQEIKINIVFINRCRSISSFRCLHVRGCGNAIRISYLTLWKGSHFRCGWRFWILRRWPCLEELQLSLRTFSHVIQEVCHHQSWSGMGSLLQEWSGSLLWGAIHSPSRTPQGKGLCWTQIYSPPGN